MGHRRGRSPGTARPSTARPAPTSRDLRKYARLFQRKDSDLDGYLTANEIQSVLRLSGLAPDVLEHILGLVGASGGGPVDFRQFAAAMHLVRCARAGQRPPPTMPAELSSTFGALRESAAELSVQGESRSASRSQSGSTPRGRSPKRGVDREAPTSRDLRKYARLFMRMGGGRGGTVDMGDFRGMLGRSGLAPDLLGHVLELADVAHRNRAEFPEFAAVMHLVRRARSDASAPGRALPSKGAASELLGALRRSAPAEELATQGSSRSASGSQSDATTSRSRSRSASRSPGKPRDVPSPRDLRKYARLFQRLVPRGADAVARDDVGGLLRRSGLPSEDVGQILDFADVGHGGRFGFQEFVAAMHLVRNARAGRRLPPGGLPPDLRDFLGDLRERPEELAKQGRSRSASSSRSGRGGGGGFEDDGFSFSGGGGGKRGFDDNFGDDVGASKIPIVPISDEPMRNLDWCVSDGNVRSAKRMGLPSSLEASGDHGFSSHEQARNPKFNARVREIMGDPSPPPAAGGRSPRRSKAERSKGTNPFASGAFCTSDPSYPSTGRMLPASYSRPTPVTSEHPFLRTVLPEFVPKGKSSHSVCTNTDAARHSLGAGPDSAAGQLAKLLGQEPPHLKQKTESWRQANPFAAAMPRDLGPFGRTWAEQPWIPPHPSWVKSEAEPEEDCIANCLADWF